MEVDEPGSPQVSHLEKPAGLRDSGRERQAREEPTSQSNDPGTELEAHSGPQMCRCNNAWVSEILASDTGRSQGL